MKKVLIAYYTKTNTTMEIANEIANVLKNSNLEVTVLPMNQITSVSEYDGIIIGAPIYGMKWSQEAVNFISTHESELLTKKNAIFLNAYMLCTGRRIWRNLINKSLDKTARNINSLSIGKFGGRIDGPLPSAMRFIFGVKKDISLDQRNHENIKSWAKEVGKLMT